MVNYEYNRCVVIVFIVEIKQRYNKGNFNMRFSLRKTLSRRVRTLGHGLRLYLPKTRET